MLADERTLSRHFPRSHSVVRRCLISSVCAIVAAFSVAPLHAQARGATPIRQSTLTTPPATPVPVTIEDASHDDRWLGLAPRDVRWSPDGASIYFRWNQRPTTSDLPQGDPWFRADANGNTAEQLSPRDAEVVPGDDLVWNGAGTLAAWSTGNSLYIYQSTATPSTRRVATFERAPSNVRFAEKGGALHFMLGESLYRYQLAQMALGIIATRVTVDPATRTPAAIRLAEQQRELSSRVRELDRRHDVAGQLDRARLRRPQSIPVPTGSQLEDIQLTPDGRTLTFRVRTPAPNRPSTKYVDFADPSGYSKVLDARSKVGEPRDRVRLGALTIDVTVPAESLLVRWFTLSESGKEGTNPHGPSWSVDESRAVVQFAGEHAKDLWIASVDPSTGRTTLIVHEHDDGWLGG
ncbi:MAG: hypothetical protein ABIT38_01455, partial [Gemmatimonadaceae bacterium]